VGPYYLGPWSERGDTPLQNAASVAYTRKDFSGYWDFYPEEAPAVERSAKQS
jgi:hypothetical protein